MVNKNNNEATRNYKKIGIIAAAVVAVGVIGIFAVSALNSKKSSNLDTAMEVISTDAANGANLRIAVIRMDAIQNGANALKDLRRQKESYESQLRDELTRDQKALEKEKAEIENPRMFCHATRCSAVSLTTKTALQNCNRI